MYVIGNAFILHKCAPRSQTCARNKKIFFTWVRRSGHVGNCQSRWNRASQSALAAQKKPQVPEDLELSNHGE